MNKSSLMGLPVRKLPSSYALEGHFHLLFSRMANASYINQTRNMFAERRQEKDS